MILAKVVWDFEIRGTAREAPGTDITPLNIVLRKYILSRQNETCEWRDHDACDVTSRLMTSYFRQFTIVPLSIINRITKTPKCDWAACQNMVAAKTSRLSSRTD